MVNLLIIVGLILLALQYYTCKDIDIDMKKYNFHFEKKSIIIMSIPFGLYYLLIKKTIKNLLNDKKRNTK